MKGGDGERGGFGEGIDPEDYIIMNVNQIQKNKFASFSRLE